MAATYSVVAVQRTPQAASAPTLTEMGPLHGAVEWTDTLNEASEGVFKVGVEGVQADIKEALRDLTLKPLEVWVYRDGEMVFAGPVIGGDIKGSVMTLNCRGLGFYMAYMLVTADTTHTDIDQYTIAESYVSGWQALSYGDFGLDTSGVGTSGTLRTAFVPGAEEPRIVLELVEDFSDLDGGFDWWVDPLTRALEFGTRGDDLSATVFLERGVQSTDIGFAVSPDVVASEVYTTGTNSGLATALTDSGSDTGLRASFGRTGTALTVDGADTVARLADATQAAVDARGGALFVPGPGLIPVAGAGVEDFGAGDTITYTFDAGLGQQTGAYVVRKRKVVVGDEGRETITMEFA